MKLTKEDLLVAAEAAEKWPKGLKFLCWTIDGDKYPDNQRKNGIPGIGCPALCVAARHKKKSKFSQDLQDEAFSLIFDVYYKKYGDSYTIDPAKKVAKRFRQLAEGL